MSGPIKISNPISTLPESQRLSKEEFQNNQDQKIRDAATMWEKMFLGEMVKAMRKTVTRSELSKPSMAQKIYEQKMDQQYVEKWGDKGGIGLSHLIYQQLKERFYSPKHPELNQPKGPLSTDKGRVIELRKPPSEGGALPVESSQPQDSAMTWQLFPEAQPGQPSLVDVVSPWSGKVSRIDESENGHVFLTLVHGDQNVSSQFHFKGRAQVESGEVLAAGQKLGQLSSEEGGLTWKVTKSDLA